MAIPLEIFWLLAKKSVVLSYYHAAAKSDAKQSCCLVQEALRQPEYYAKNETRDNYGSTNGEG